MPENHNGRQYQDIDNGLTKAQTTTERHARHFDWEYSGLVIMSTAMIMDVCQTDARLQFQAKKLAEKEGSVKYLDREATSSAHLEEEVEKFSERRGESITGELK